tara:strand:+ start:594 stop:1478 length:885 start_codon:yes stop_codon:yes gene_type:complete
MSKLFKLKSWLTLDEAVNYASDTLDENITKADFFRLAADGQLKLSVKFINGAFANTGILEKVDFTVVKKEEENNKDNKDQESEFLNCFLIDGKFSRIDHNSFENIGRDLWDLCLLGAVEEILESNYYQVITGKETAITDKSGILLTNKDQELLVQLRTNKLGEEAGEEGRIQYDKVKHKDVHDLAESLEEYDYLFAIRMSEINSLLNKTNPEIENLLQRPASNFSERITETQVWNDLYQSAEKAYREFPLWREKMKRPHHFSMNSLDDWLSTTLKVTKRDAETIKKILKEIYDF